MGDENRKELEMYRKKENKKTYRRKGKERNKRRIWKYMAV